MKKIVQPLDYITPGREDAVKTLDDLGERGV
jgi:hypothetical protein